MVCITKFTAKFEVWQVGRKKTAQSSHRVTSYAVQKQQRIYRVCRKTMCVYQDFSSRAVTHSKWCVGILPQLSYPIPSHAHVTFPISIPILELCPWPVPFPRNSRGNAECLSFSRWILLQFYSVITASCVVLRLLFRSSPGTIIICHKLNLICSRTLSYIDVFLHTAQL